MIDLVLKGRSMKRKKIYFTTLLIIISSCLYAVFSFFNIAEARLELSVIRPFDEFVTNNREIVIEGVVRYSEGQAVTVSITTPSGVSDLGAINNTLRSITVDVGSSQSLTTMIINPVFKNELSMAPSVVKLSFSDNGQTFQDKELHEEGGPRAEHESGSRRNKPGQDIRVFSAPVGPGQCPQRPRADG